MNVFTFFANTWEDVAWKEQDENKEIADEDKDILPDDEEDHGTKRRAQA